VGQPHAPAAYAGGGSGSVVVIGRSCRPEDRKFHNTLVGKIMPLLGCDRIGLRVCEQGGQLLVWMGGLSAAVDVWCVYMKPETHELMRSDIDHVKWWFAMHLPDTVPLP
jgi:hypothetical protein